MRRWVGLVLVALLATACGDDGGGDDGSVGVPDPEVETPRIDPTAEPTPGDPSAADAALPPDAGFSFVARSVAVEGNGEYVVSAIVPEGWDTDEEDDPFFGVTFDPVGGDFGFFSEMSFRAGCDGLCEPTDWQARLEDEDGFLTNSRANFEHLTDEPLADGWLLVSEGFSGGIDGTVFVWNSGADRYLVCDFTLDEEDTAYLDAFVAACGSSSPGWFPS